MRVSIVTAVLNAEKLVAKTLASVASQDHHDIEQIIVDGGSTDDTLALIEREPGRVKTIVGGKDTGVYDAINKGIRVSTGDLIICLNAGDYYRSDDVISRMVEIFQRSDVGGVFANLDIVDPTNESRVIRGYRVDGFTPDRLLWGMMPPHPTLMIRKSIYEQFGLYDASFRIAGDFDFCLRVFLKGRVPYAHIPESLVVMPAGGLSNRHWWTFAFNTMEMHRACSQNEVGANWLKLISRLPRKWLQD